MFVHTLEPVIVQLGPLAIRWYSLAYIAGFLISYWWLRKVAKTARIRNLTLDRVDTLLIALIIGVVAGGRLGHIIYFDPSAFWNHPWEIFMLWRGGMAFHGGLVGAFLGAWWFSRKYKVSLLEIADVLVIPASFALFLGRIANFINAELVGRVTDVPWCVQFNGEVDALGSPVCRHPSQLYEAAQQLVMVGALALLDRKERPPGTLLWWFLILYGALRFVTNIWRDDPLLFLGMSTGQLLSLVMAVVGAYFLLSRKA